MSETTFQLGTLTPRHAENLKQALELRLEQLRTDQDYHMRSFDIEYTDAMRIAVEKWIAKMHETDRLIHD